MLRLSKRVEYALFAVQLMAARGTARVSAKDVALQFGISQALVAKVLQVLAQADIVASFHGAQGGYVLAREAERITIAEIIQAVEGATTLVVCFDESDHQCSVHTQCTIKQPLILLQQRISATLESMSVAELLHPEHVNKFYTLETEVVL
jgi:FeS assembly SUF system regulator